MFCSKCGKTLPMDAAQCPFCALPVGESRFEGSPYTSAQSRILPGDDVPTYTRDYTRVNYTSEPYAADQGDVDVRTTYRPTYGGDSIPEDMRRDIRQAATARDEPQPEEEPAFDPQSISQSAAETLNALDDELRMEEVDKSRFRARPIESAGRSGISADVSEMMQELENEAPRGSRRRRSPSYSEDVDYETSNPNDGAAPAGEDQDEVFEDIEDEEFDELRHSSFGFKQIIRIVIALVIVAALFVGGVMWFRYVRGNTSSAPIENVRETLYTDGIALIKNHASEEYIAQILNQYTASGSNVAALSAQMDTSTAEVTALLPEDATENEQLYVNALNKIQSNIVNCIITDAMSLSQPGAQADSLSAANWTVVTNSIAMLEKAGTAQELTAIVNGEVVNIEELQATPSPEPKVNYNTLSKGDKSDEVLTMQNRLYELGYLNDDRDGAFGNKTQTAVKMFQQVAGLPITGIADSDTLNALYATDAPGVNTVATATPEPAPTLAPVSTPETTPEAVQ